MQSGSFELAFEWKVTPHKKRERQKRYRNDIEPNSVEKVLQYPRIKTRVIGKKENQSGNAQKDEGYTEHLEVCYYLFGKKFVRLHTGEDK